MNIFNHNSVIGIIGCGTMGRGIAQVVASNHHNVIIYDVSEEAIKNAEFKLQDLLNRLVEKGKFSNEYAKNILQRISFEKKITSLKNCELIIEAVIENLQVKQKLFSFLETIVSKNTILATNTSSLSITSIASACKKKERVIGTHFFNPAPLMQLVEVVPGLLTNKETTQKVKELITEWGKTAVTVKDTPGFIVNRVARPFYGEALRIMEEGIADVVTIDWAMKEIGKFKLGPFELMDLIGNDVNYKVTETVFKQFYFDPRFKPSTTQKRMVEAGLLGKKSGKGFYNYTETKTALKPNKDKSLGEEIFFRILSMLINEAADAVFMNVATVNDIDLAMTKGVNYPKGLLGWADEIGIDRIVKRLNLLYENYNEERYRISPLLKKMASEGLRFYN